MSLMINANKAPDRVASHHKSECKYGSHNIQPKNRHRPLCQGPEKWNIPGKYPPEAPAYTSIYRNNNFCSCNHVYQKYLSRYEKQRKSAVHNLMMKGD